MTSAARRSTLRDAPRWLLSLAFNAHMYLVMALMAVVFTPWALVDRRGAFAGIRSYARYVRWAARVWLGLHTEVRGTVPDGEVLIAAKHQSFLDILVICSVVPRPKFVMKRELVRMPILGWYALRIGCVPVDRGKRGAAVSDMLKAVEAGRDVPGQLIIYPQGTRVAPGVKAPYKIGAFVLYEASGQACVPAATNVGAFWPRSGVMRRPGRGVVTFLELIPPGLPQDVFLARLEQAVEAESDRLLHAVASPREARG